MDRLLKSRSDNPTAGKSLHAARRYCRGLLAALALAVAPPGAAASNLPFATHSTDLQQELQRVPEASAGLAVLFEQADCPACAHLRQTVLPQPAAGAALKRWRTATVQIDGSQALVGPGGEAQSAVGLAQSLGVLGTPAIAFFDRNGRLLYRYMGRLRDGRDLALLTRFVTTRRFDELPFAEYLRQQRRPGSSSRHAAHH
jgi:thioredoxin-related protein